MQKYIEVKENATGITHVKVWVYYEIGGLDFWSYQNKPRGYYISAVPVIRKEKNGYSTECFGVYSGLNQLLRSVQRKSAKAEAEAEKLAADAMDNLIDYVCKKNGLELLEMEV